MKKLFIALLCLLQTTWMTGQTSKGLSPMDISSLQSVSQVLIHEDGEKAAYTVTVPADPLVENKSASYRLYLLDIESGQSTPMVTAGMVRSVKFRPEHESLTFLAKRDGDQVTRLYEISLRGGEAQPLFTYKHSISDYEWSADGAHLAFYASEYQMPAENISGEKLPYEPEVYEENLPLARAYIVDMKGGEPKSVAVPGNISRIAWSNKKDRLAVAASPTSLVDDYYMKQVIHIVDVESLEVAHRIAHEGKLGDFAFSPNGNKLAMIAAADINDPIDGRLFVVDDFSEAPKNLQPDFEGKFESFSWLDNDDLMFLASEGVQTFIGTIEADGDEMKRVLDSKGGVAWGSFAAADDDAILLSGSSPQHPTEVFFYKRGEDTARRITNVNPWLSEKQFGKQQMISYQARDGQEIQGLVIYPVNYQEGRRYPLITVVHGGPESHYNNGWLTSYSSPGQMAAARGYMVFYPNYRGSTGRGEKFAKSSQGDLAGKEFDDIVDGVDYLIEQGYVDGNKVGVTGGSYGGYATAWLSTKYTDRFAAGVMFVGISNNLSKWGTSDIPEELYHVHARKRVYDDYQFFLERSPIYYAGQTKTPLLIMHGKEDTRVHPGQSIELYRHIKTRTDTPVRLVLYPGEGHGNRNATARLDYSLRMLRWFDKYLKNDESVQLDTQLRVEGMER